MYEYFFLSLLTIYSMNHDVPNKNKIGETESHGYC